MIAVMSEQHDQRGIGLGSLERGVMEILWRLGRPTPAREVQTLLLEVDPARRPALAYATVRTVLDRLTRKHLLIREPDPASRAMLYRTAASREDYIAELMLAALNTAGDRNSALIRFAEGITTDEAAVLRSSLSDHEP
jgi:predicted transcriptional regulator